MSKPFRYAVHPIDNPDCDHLAPRWLCKTNSLVTAKRWARKYSGRFLYGTGIQDRETGLIDVGFGFGVPCPDPTGL